MRLTSSFQQYPEESISIQFRDIYGVKSGSAASGREIAKPKSMRTVPRRKRLLKMSVLPEPVAGYAEVREVLPATRGCGSSRRRFVQCLGAAGDPFTAKEIPCF